MNQTCLNRAKMHDPIPIGGHCHTMGNDVDPHPRLQTMADQPLGHCANICPELTIGNGRCPNDYPDPFMLLAVYCLKYGHAFSSSHTPANSRHSGLPRDYGYPSHPSAGMSPVASHFARKMQARGPVRAWGIKIPVRLIPYPTAAM